MKNLKWYGLGLVVTVCIAVITLVVREIDSRGYERGRTEHVKAESAEADSVYQVAKDSIEFLKLVVAERDSDLAHVHVETNVTIRGARRQLNKAQATIAKSDSAIADSGAVIRELRTELVRTADTLEAVLARIPVERDAAAGAIAARDTLSRQQDTTIAKADTAIAKKAAVVDNVEKAGKKRGKIAKIVGVGAAAVGVVVAVVKWVK